MMTRRLLPAWMAPAWTALPALMLLPMLPGGSAAAMPAVSDAVELQEAAVEAKAQVIVLHATNSKAGIDDKIPAEAREKLKQPPFSAYDSYALLDRTELTLSLRKEGKLALPNRDKLALKLNRADRKYHVSVSVTKPDGDRVLSVDAKAKKGELFFIAGPKHKDGILVLGIQLQPKS